MALALVKFAACTLAAGKFELARTSNRSSESSMHSLGLNVFFMETSFTELFRMALLFTSYHRTEGLSKYSHRTRQGKAKYWPKWVSFFAVQTVSFRILKDFL